jgi:hypothetical protein
MQQHNNIRIARSISSMPQSVEMVAFAWPNAAQGTASSGIMASPSTAAPTATTTGTANPPEPTSTASDGGAFFSSDASTITSTAVDSGVFYSSDVAASTSTSSYGGAFYSSAISTSAATTATSTALYSGIFYPPPKATGVAFDRGTPFEMSDPIISVVDPSQHIHVTFARRENARFGRDQGPIIGGVLTFFTVVLVFFLSIKYCARSCSRSKKKTTDLERGDSARCYPYYEESVRGRKRRRDGSPPVTRPDDITISESYGMDPVDLARSQTWQEGFDERGVYSTQDRVNRDTSTDNFQSTATYGNGDGGEYSVQLPSFIPTRRVNTKPVPVTKLPGLARNPEYTAGQPVSPLDTADEQHDSARMREYSDVSPLHSPAMHHEGCK